MTNHFNFSARYADIVSDIELELVKSRDFRVQLDVFSTRVHMSVDNLSNTEPVLPKNILEVNGKGLIAAIIFRKSKNIGSTLKKVVEECLKEGLLVVYTGRESIKIGPPLTISSDALKEGLGILKKNIHKIFINNNGKN